jgi:hypothetical protein
MMFAPQQRRRRSRSAASADHGAVADARNSPGDRGLWNSRGRAAGDLPLMLLGGRRVGVDVMAATDS